MSRSIIALVLVAGCSAGGPNEPASTQEALAAAGGTLVDNIQREHLSGDVYHYRVDLHVGSGPNAVLRIHRVVRERAPFVPRASHDAVMMMHGDFSTFTTSFLPKMAPYFAGRNFDVWGLDRRWTHAPAGAGADVSDFATMGFAQELGDIGRALAFARAARIATGSGDDRLTLIGFSRGAHLAYAYAAKEGGQPRLARHVKALVPLDSYGEIAPDDQVGHDSACAGADFENQAVADGNFDSDNSFFVKIGQRALSAPDEISKLFDDGVTTNRGAFLLIVGQTYLLYAPTPLYHLLAGNLGADGSITALRETPEAVGEAWFAGAAPHQSMLESAEGDTLWCGVATPPITVDLSRIEVPLYYLGAAGGIGDRGLYSTTRVRSRDITRTVIHRFGADRVAEDFGHADLLFATDAPTLAWQPLATWIAGR